MTLRVAAEGDTIAPGEGRETVGLFFKKTKPSEDLARNGLRGRATVEHSEMRHGGMEVNVSARSTDAVLSGEKKVKAIEGLGLDPHQVARDADEARRKALEEQQGPRGS